MAIRFNCTKCSHLLQVPDTTAGRKAKCPNCGHVLPVPGDAKPPAAKSSAKPGVAIPSGTKPSVAKPSAGKPSRPAPKPVGMESVAGPIGPGPIPTIAGKKKKDKKKGSTAGGDRKAPPELRSGKKAVIIGAALVVVLVGTVVAWKMEVFGGKEPDKPPAKKRVPTRTRTVTPKTEEMSAEEIKAVTNQMEAKLAGLAERLELEPSSLELDEAVIEQLRELEKYSGTMPARALSTTNLGVQIDENKAWLYENVLAKAESLVGEYRFKTAKELLAKALASEAKAAAKEEPSQRGRTTRQVAKGPAAEQACRELAEGELIKQGLSGKVSLWTQEQVDEAGNTTVIISVNEPQPQAKRASTTRRPGSTRSRTETPASGNWQQTWGPVSGHLALIRNLLAKSERNGDMARAGKLYNMARELEGRCISFETPGAADAELLNQLARLRVNRKVHEQIEELIRQCRYEEALALGNRLLDENPSNPDNHFWVLRCYLESYNGKALPIKLSDLRGMAQRAADLTKYDLPNNLLSVGLGSDDQPAELAIADYRQWGRRRGRRLEELSAYAGENGPIVEWLSGESRTAALEDFQYLRFLSGEPIDLLDSKGVIYTVYSRGGPAGQAALMVARIADKKKKQGIYLQMEDGYRYRLWNVYPPESAGTSTNIPVRADYEPVEAIKEIRAVGLSGERTIPLLTSLRVLRCEQEGSGWSLLIPQGAIHREQREEETPRTSRSTTSDRRASTSTSRTVPSMPGLGERTGSTSRTSRTRSSRDSGQNGLVRIAFGSSGSRSRTAAGDESEPITCLTREEQVETAYFSDNKGKYLIGPGGMRFYVSEGGFLSSGRTGEGPQWCLALSGNKCPERLRSQLRDFSDGEFSTERLGDSPLSVSEAAIWLGSVAGQVSGQRTRTSSRSIGPVLGRSSGVGRRSSAGGEVPIVSRWVNAGGRVIALVDAQIVEVAESGMIRSEFYSADEAMELLGQATERYQASLGDWPTVGGEVYTSMNAERLGELIGQDAQRRSSRSVRGGRTAATDLKSELIRAGRYIATGDFNQALAISGDLTGALSIRLRQATDNDAISVTGTDGRTSTARGEAGPIAPMTDPFLNDVQSRARQAVGAGPRTRGTRSGARATQEPSLAADEEYFSNAEMLVQSLVLQAAAYQQGGMPERARQSANQAVYRIKGYMQGELIEWIRELQSQGARVSPRLIQIRDQWQKVGETGFDVALERSLQAAEGKMSLASWLSGEAEGSGSLSAKSLFAARQFDSVRMSILGEDSEETEEVDAEEQARQIIELLKTYEVSSGPEAEIAEALWELGSYMSAVGRTEEAEHCLGQAGAIYSELAQSLLPGTSRLASQPPHVLEEYYRYRVAGLSALAQSAASGEEAVWPDGYGLMLAEIESKLEQINRRWSDTSDENNGLTKMLNLADHATIAVQDMNKSGGLYEFPRVRFWWWYYPAAGADESAVAAEGTIGHRPKLEYVEGAPGQPSRTNRGRRGPQPVMPGMPPGMVPPVPPAR